ncbi:MAG: hypothetical protein ACRD5Z_25405 [Bryobacteraceae bacterium]
MRGIGAWESGLLLAVCWLCNAREILPVRIQIAIYDQADLGEKTLASAESLTGKILLASGLKAEWRTGSISDLQWLLTDFTARNVSECASVPTSGLLRVQVLPRAPGGIPAQALGFSLPCAMTGIKVTIYADRIAQVSERTALPFSRVLGCALAHELGHVLLHSAAHENSGLMRAVWSKSDWQRAAAGVMSFSPEQARRMLGPIHGASSAETVQRASIRHH